MTTHNIGKYSFQCTELHLSDERKKLMRSSYDQLGHAAMGKLREIANKRMEEIGATEQGHCQTDFYEVLKNYHTEDKVLSRFWREINTVPEWVDWEQLKRGQMFFYRYALANIMGFALQGFMGENAAAPGTAEVLVRTGSFSTRKLGRRLLDTFQFLLEVTHSIDSIQPGGAGHVTTVRVRLLHARVRQRVLELAKSHPDYFDIKSFGVPVNDIDSVQAIATFCCNPFWLQLPVMGIYPSSEEKADYIALFRYIAYVVGTPYEYFASSDRARATMESLLLDLRISDTSRILGHNFMQCLIDLPPFNVSSQFIEAGSRKLNGYEFCDSLGLGHPGYYSYACFTGYCWLAKCLAVAQHLSPSLDSIISDFFRTKLYKAVINNSTLAGGSKMQYKYIPKLGKKVGQEDHGRHRHTSWIFARPMESMLFSLYITGCLVIIVPPLAIVGVVWNRLYEDDSK